MTLPAIVEPQYRSSSGKAEGTSTLFREKEEVKRALRMQLHQDKRWVPIATIWFEAWKRYVDFDNSVAPDRRPQEVLADLYPGPIDNTPIIGAIRTELKPGLIEPDDYILLPFDTAKVLADRYGGGPLYDKGVARIGGSLVVELYLIRFEVYLCDKKNDIAPNIINGDAICSTESDTFKYWWSSRTCDLGIIIKDLYSRVFKVTGRAWIKVPSSDCSTVEGVNESVDGGSSGDGTTTVPPRRYLTAHEVERFGRFRLIRNPPKTQVTDLISDREMVVEMILESMGQPINSIPESDWPLCRPLNKWKTSLRVGDLINAKDKQGIWFEAVVVELPKTEPPKSNTLHPSSMLRKFPALDHSVTVHFKGWKSTYDEILSGEKIFSHIEPLYSKCSNWRGALTLESVVEVKISPTEKDFSAAQVTTDNPHRSDNNNVWVKGKVLKIEPVVSGEKGNTDEREKRVMIEYTRSDVIDTLRTLCKVTPSSLAKSVTAVSVSAASDDSAECASTPMAYSYSSDNDNATGDSTPTPALAAIAIEMDNFSEGVANSASTAMIVAPTEVNAAVVAADEGDESVSDVMTCWVDLMGEEICQLYTHIPSPTSRNSHGGISALTNHANSIDTRDYDYDLDKHTRGKPLVRGAVGLQNLGNTCFMNSILQCLSNTPPLTSFFLDDAYKRQINTDNALGHGGKVAEAYANLIREMWSDVYTKVVPRNLKKTIGEFQPQFAGYQQQDSQEFMGFLLDGLHEDLNRIIKKPAVENIESRGREDDIVSRESWRRFLLRNDSALVDNFYGQLKSHVTCVNCGKESVTFDPFNCLSLPVPVKTSRPVTVLVRLLPVGSAPLRLAVNVEPTEQVKDIKNKVIKRLLSLQYLADPSSQSNNGTRNHRGNHDASPSSLHNPAMDLDVEDYDIITHEDASDPSVALGSTNSKSNGKDSNNIKADILSNFIFHAAALGHDLHRIDKNLEDSAPVGDILRGRENVLLYQLQHPVQYKVTSVGYSPQYPAAAVPVDNPTVADNYVTYIDLYLGRMSKDSYPRIICKGLPMRFNVPSDISGCDLYNIVAHAAKLYTRKTSPFYHDIANRPFSLHLTNAWGSNLRAGIPDNDELLNLLSSDFVIAVWKDEACDKEHFDNAEFERVVAISDGDSTQQQIHQQPHDPPAVVAPSANNRAVSPLNKSRKITPSVVVSAGGVNLDGSEDADAKQRQQGGLTVLNCIDKFIEREQLNQEETLYCSTCKQHLAPVKKMDIWAAPDVLILHLKRFQYIPGAYFVHREKIQELVQFPLQDLDLRPYVKGPQVDSAPPIYDLFAVSMHSGGLGGGHYTAVCKNESNQKWYNFNDSFVSEVPADTAVSEQSYVLFYRRKKGFLRWAGISPLTVEESNRLLDHEKQQQQLRHT